MTIVTKYLHSDRQTIYKLQQIGWVAYPFLLGKHSASRQTSFCFSSRRGLKIFQNEEWIQVSWSFTLLKPFLQNLVTYACVRRDTMHTLPLHRWFYLKSLKQYSHDENHGATDTQRQHSAKFSFSHTHMKQGQSDQQDLVFKCWLHWALSTSSIRFAEKLFLSHPALAKRSSSRFRQF